MLVRSTREWLEANGGRISRLTICFPGAGYASRAHAVDTHGTRVQIPRTTGVGVRSVASYTRFIGQPPDYRTSMYCTIRLSSTFGLPA